MVFGCDHGRIDAFGEAVEIRVVDRV